MGRYETLFAQLKTAAKALFPSSPSAIRGGTVMKIIDALIEAGADALNWGSFLRWPTARRFRAPHCALCRRCYPGAVLRDAGGDPPQVSDHSIGLLMREHGVQPGD